MGMGYIAFNLNAESRADIIRRFPPKFEKVIAHHVTHQFGVSSDSPLPGQQLITVIGYASNDHIECLVVTVGGTEKRPDGAVYHVTLSHKVGASAKMSNDLIEEKGWEAIPSSFPIHTEPMFNPF